MKASGEIFLYSAKNTDNTEFMVLMWKQHGVGHVSRSAQGTYVIYQDLDRERGSVCWFGTFQSDAEASLFEGNRADLCRFTTLEDAKKSCENHFKNLASLG